MCCPSDLGEKGVKQLITDAETAVISLSSNYSQQRFTLQYRRAVNAAATMATSRKPPPPPPVKKGKGGGGGGQSGQGGHGNNNNKGGGPGKQGKHGGK